MGRLAVLFVVAFVDMIGLVIIVPLLPFYATDFGASAFTVGVLISAFSVAQLLSAPFWGRLSDRRGRRPAILVALWVSASAYLLFAFAGSVVALLVSRIVQGLGGGTIGVVQAYVADASRPEDRAKSLGWLSAATSAGAFVGPGLGSLLADIWGQHAPGIASAGLCIVVSGFAWRYLAESKELRHSSASMAAMRVAPRSERQALLHVVESPGEPASRLIWLYTVAIGAFYGTVPILPLLLAEQLQVTERTMGYFIMYLGGMGLVVRALVLGRMVDWLGDARLTRLGIVLLSAGLVLVSWADSYPVLMLSLTLMPLGTAFIFPCVTGLLSRVVRSNERGLFLGVQQTFGGLSRVAVPVTAGVLMDHVGIASPFWISGVLLLLTLPLTRPMEGYIEGVVPTPLPIPTPVPADSGAFAPLELPRDPGEE